jgi:hypothetical protein
MLLNEIDLSVERSRAALQPMEGPRIKQGPTRSCSVWTI